MGLPNVVVKDGKKLLSDTVFRQILPKELRPMSKYLKQMCCCMICESMAFKQSALNQFRRDYLEHLKHNWETLPDGNTRNQIAAKLEAKAKYLDYKAQAFCADGSDLHLTSRDAAMCIQCVPPPDFAGTGFTRLKCASGKCTVCPKYKRPAAEETTSKMIKF